MIILFLLLLIIILKYLINKFVKFELICFLKYKVENYKLVAKNIISCLAQNLIKNLLIFLILLFYWKILKTVGGSTPPPQPEGHIA